MSNLFQTVPEPTRSIWGFAPVPAANETLMALSRTREIGEIVTWDNGQQWRLVERYSSPLAGGHYISPVYAVWFRAVEVL
jgi:hypothetical protein